MKKIVIITIILIAIILVGILINNLPKVIEEKDNCISAYNNPIIPQGFKEVETETASWKRDEDGNPIEWNNGLVIEDEIGNQFVWVPVKDLNLNDELDKCKKYLQDVETGEENDQISKYGGFYIARFEAGVTDEMQKNINNISSITNDIEGIPVSKQGRLPWNYITLKNAKKNAESMYKENQDVYSGLITNRQWLYLMQWISNSGYDINELYKLGNFVDSNINFTGYYSVDLGKTFTYKENGVKDIKSVLLSTGASEKNKINNIYNLVGNLIEFTNSYDPNRGYYSVGGHFCELSNGNFYNPRTIGDKTPLEKIGFRVVLYNKN